MGYAAGPGTVIATDTIFDAKGDIVAGTADNTAAKLTVGANNSYLRPDSTQATGLKYVAASVATPAATSNSAGAAGTAGNPPSADDHVHLLTAHGAANHTDITRTIWLTATGIAAADGTATATIVGAAPDQTGTRQLADAATNGVSWVQALPADAVAASAVNARISWLPASTDGTAHTVRWSFDTLVLAAGGGTVATGAGTTNTFTGASAARTAGTTVEEATQQIIASANANDILRIDLRRIGADGADTYVGAVNVIGIFLDYTANQ